MNKGPSDNKSNESAKHSELSYELLTKIRDGIPSIKREIASKQNHLGFLSECIADYNYARIHYQYSAFLGDKSGQFNYARCLENGLGGNVDADLAKQYYNMAKM